MTKKITKIIVYVIVLGFVIWGIYSIVTAPKVPETDVVSKKGLHYHAHLSININGEEIAIPENIGVNGPMGAGGDPMEMHTHTPDGVVHLEYAGLVTKDQLRIKNFFKVWGKDFSKDSILGNKVGDGHTLTMTVNGVPNTDFENYSVTDNGTYEANEGMIDDIKIVYK